MTKRYVGCSINLCMRGSCMFAAWCVGGLAAGGVNVLGCRTVRTITLLSLPGFIGWILGDQCLVRVLCVRACGGLLSPLPGSQPVSVRCRARAPPQVVCTIPGVTHRLYTTMVMTQIVRTRTYSARSSSLWRRLQWRRRRLLSWRRRRD
jgi:hypothetical protein